MFSPRTVLALSPFLPLITAQFVPAPGNFPPNGDDTIAGGIFCIPLSDLPPYFARYPPSATGSESPKGTSQPTSGSGPYPAASFIDATLGRHTIFAPKTPPGGNVSMPFLTWANGGCSTSNSAHVNFLLEIASHGYVIAANGPMTGSQSKVSDSRDAIDWAIKGGAKKYGSVDTEKIAAMGHSCGGLEGMSVSYRDARVKRTMLFNIAIFQDNRQYLLQELKAPVAWFVGGPKDMGYPSSQKDFDLLPKGLSALRASLDTGHGGTFAALNGGKQAKAAVQYLQWQFRGDAATRAAFLDPKAPNSLVSQNWNVTYKNV